MKKKIIISYILITALVFCASCKSGFGNQDNTPSPEVIGNQVVNSGEISGDSSLDSAPEAPTKTEDIPSEEATPEVETAESNAKASLLLPGSEEMSFAEDEAASISEALKNAELCDYPFIFSPEFSISLEDGSSYEIMADSFLHGIEDGYDVTIVSDGADYYEADYKLYSLLSSKAALSAEPLIDMQKLRVFAAHYSEEDALDSFMNETLPGYIEALLGKEENPKIEVTISDYSEISVARDSIMYRPLAFDIVYGIDNGSTEVSGEEMRIFTFVITGPEGTRIYLFGTNDDVLGFADEQMNEAASALSLDITAVG